MFAKYPYLHKTAVEKNQMNSSVGDIDDDLGGFDWSERK